MAVLILRVWHELICPVCWDYCARHPSNPSNPWQALPLVETELVIPRRRADYNPVEVAWVDVTAEPANPGRWRRW